MKFRYSIAEFHGIQQDKRLPAIVTERRGILMYGNGINDFIPIYRKDVAKPTLISLFGDTKSRRPELIPVHTTWSTSIG
jgi:hypothetical protein